MNWLTGNWRELLPPSLATVALILVALVSGIIIGEDRERREKAAGLRTIILVCLGSAAFTMVSFIFSDNHGDTGRIAAQIVTGIGFLGAGVILHGRGTVSGTTTAATIWATSSVGMIAGAGYAGAAIGMSLLVRWVLTAISIYEDHLVERRKPVIVTLDFDSNHGRTRIRLERILIDYRAAAVIAEWGKIEKDQCRLTLKLRLQKLHLRELLSDLVSVSEVRSVNEENGQFD